MQKPKRLNQKQVKIMSNNTKDKGGKRDWSMALGFYPGILFGMRSYHGPTHSQHVFTPWSSNSPLEAIVGRMFDYPVHLFS